MTDDPDEPYKEEISKLLDLAKFAMLCIMGGSGYLGAISLGIV